MSLEILFWWSEQPLVLDFSLPPCVLVFAASDRTAEFACVVGCSADSFMELVMLDGEKNESVTVNGSLHLCDWKSQNSECNHAA